MGIRVRPIGEQGLPSADDEQVKCWKCQALMRVRRTVTRATCPECGSLVAVHRLRMPALPSGPGGGGDRDRKKEIVRLGEGGRPGANGDPPQSGARSMGALARMPVLENGETQVRLGGAGRVEAAAPVHQRFESRHRVEEIRRELFEEAEPRLPGAGESPLLNPRLTKVLVITLMTLAGLVLVAVALLLRNG